MIRKYALFSKAFPIVHWLFVAILALIQVGSSYLILESNQLIFAWGVILPALPIFLFATASSYKKKYLHS
ncbi:hypothetical protein EDI28_10630 [Photobacterium chitinilyticum]|uniref:Uncharacterized protein n=1 Tax=Photobacterium chitinilyticum TaxID=2485123 RepID=A0A444JRP1_9GAMM|nr:hypothetical protein EDI28_10630 [Photobacterium chitinilyticum]